VGPSRATVGSAGGRTVGYQGIHGQVRSVTIPVLLLPHVSEPKRRIATLYPSYSLSGQAHRVSIRSRFEVFKNPLTDDTYRATCARS
jgi:hypothetical protein